MSDTDKLEPCPFCGGAARIESNRDWHRLYAAHDDDCVLDADEADLMYPAQPGYLIEIAETWNRRAAKRDAIPATGQRERVANSIVQDVADLFRASGFEVREQNGQFAIAGSLDAAGVLVDAVIAHFANGAERFHWTRAGMVLDPNGFYVHHRKSDDLSLTPATEVEQRSLAGAAREGGITCNESLESAPSPSHSAASIARLIYQHTGITAQQSPGEYAEVAALAHALLTDSRAVSGGAALTDEARDADTSRRSLIVGQAFAHHGGKWPDELWTGVMHFNGERITKTDFAAIEAHTKARKEPSDA
jgi:hypothetical protein